MKWLKKFEELNPDVYKRAGEKLINIGHKDRGGELVDYSRSLESDSYNMFLGVDGGSLYGFKNAPYTFYFSKYKVIYGHTIYDNDSKDNGVGLEEMIESWTNAKSDLSIEILFYFTPSHKTKKSMSHRFIDYEYPLFSIKYLISIPHEPMDDSQDITEYYEFMENFEISLNNPRSKIFGIFSDKKSATLFAKKVLPNAIDDAKEKLTDLYSALGTDNSHYESCIEKLDKITNNYLYKTKLEDDIGNILGGGRLMHDMFPIVYSEY